MTRIAAGAVPADAGEQALGRRWLWLPLVPPLVLALVLAVWRDGTPRAIFALTATLLALGAWLVEAGWPRLAGILAVAACLVVPVVGQLGDAGTTVSEEVVWMFFSVVAGGLLLPVRLQLAVAATNVVTISLLLLANPGIPRGTAMAVAAFVASSAASVALFSWREQRDAASRAAIGLRLLDSQRRNVAMLRAVPDLIFVFDHQGRYLDVQAPDPRLLVAPAVRLLGRTVGEVLPPAVAEELARSIAQVAASGQALSFEHELEVLGGRRTFEGRLVPCQPDQVLLIERDVTAHRRAQVDRDAQKRLLEEAEAVGQLGSFEILAAERAVRWSPQLRRMFGLEAGIPEPCFADLLERFVHPADRDLLLERAASLNVDGGVVEVEARIRGLDGRERWIRGRAEAIKEEGRVLRVTGLLQDVTELRASQAAQRSQTEQIRLFLENFEGVAFELDSVAGRPTLVEGRVREILGRAREDFLSGRVSFAQLVHKADAERVLAEVRRIAAQPTRFDLTYRIVHPDGTVRHIREIGRSLAGPDQRVNRVQGAIYDATALQESAEARRRFEQQRGLFLAKIIETQEEERRRIARELHDGIGQSLSGILVRLAALGQGRDRDRIAPGDLREVRQLVSSAVEELRLISKGLHPTALDDLGLPTAVRRFAETTRTTHGLTVEVHFAADTDWDRLAPQVNITLYRIVQEALGNVARHAKASTASVTVAKVGERLRLIVEDDGQGFDPDQTGGGLGLHSIRERAALLGGSTRFESQPGSGTAVVVDLPLATELSSTGPWRLADLRAPTV